MATTTTKRQAELERLRKELLQKILQREARRRRTAK